MVKILHGDTTIVKNFELRLIKKAIAHQFITAPLPTTNVPLKYRFLLVAASSAHFSMPSSFIRLKLYSLRLCGYRAAPSADGLNITHGNSALSTSPFRRPPSFRPKIFPGRSAPVPFRPHRLVPKIPRRYTYEEIQFQLILGHERR